MSDFYRNKYRVRLIWASNVLYIVALFSTNWFTNTDISYGVWWVRFCDVLACQILPAFYTQEPIWYHIVQFLLSIGWIGQLVSLMLILTKKPAIFKKRSQKSNLTAFISILSAFIISFAILMFYVRLRESYAEQATNVPQISWASYMAALVCLFDLIIGLSSLVVG